MDEQIPHPRRSNETLDPSRDAFTSYVPGEIAKALDPAAESGDIAYKGTSRIRGAREPVSENVLESLRELHGSPHPEAQVAYIERLTDFEPHQRQQVEEYIEKNQTQAWPLADERLEQLYTMSRADEDDPIKVFAEELRGLTSEQQAQFNAYRNGRITEEAKEMARSSASDVQARAIQSETQNSKFVSMPGENATATPEEMRQQAAAMRTPDHFQVQPPKAKKSLLRRFFPWRK